MIKEIERVECWWKRKEKEGGVLRIDHTSK
jgi:hypothetical protein